MNYCMECGTKLTKKFLKNEGMIPYCDTCKEFRFPVFNTAVSMIVMNEEQDKILLIKQYGGDDYILVAGYVNQGENAEHAVVREVKEEVGLDVLNLHFNKSEYYKKSNTLMLNFTCIVEEKPFALAEDEVDHAEWFSLEEARAKIEKGNLAQRFLIHYLDNLL
ncbi:NADH pyrophosphatase [Lachnospiraceae bacterium KM106-2]|nr:NADH pyrophosphatase [Lachnospiraceae bacterium KM106-2]